MREQLAQYVELLFAGAKDCEDIKQEILQNTLDRYDDLIAEGKVPEAAYRLAITGIGDISEILGTSAAPAPVVQAVSNPKSEADTPAKKIMRAVAVGLYILCAIPLIVLSEMGMDILGLCGTLCIAAVATVLIILGGKKDPDEEEKQLDQKLTPEEEVNKSIGTIIGAIGLGAYLIISVMTGAWHLTWVVFPLTSAAKHIVLACLTPEGLLKNSKAVCRLIWAIGLAVYMLLSFETMAWYITWLIFPICGSGCGLFKAILDYKEAVRNET